MRPISLTFQAFGSYPGTHTVDFAALGRRGLFLVTGPTGTGKTTVFDAMVYALYGELPGGRSGKGEPRSHHAAGGVETFVEFEFEAGGERFRVRRTPAWERPKQRGEGFTTQSPAARLDRIDGAASHAVANKSTDVSSECRRLVGLDASQFQRVVLLPQGKFTDFLIATPESRKELLSELFGGGLYEKATDWLKATKQDLDRQVAVSDVDVKHHRDNAITSLGAALSAWPVAELPDEPSDADLAEAIGALEPEAVKGAEEVAAAGVLAGTARTAATEAREAAKRFDDAAGYRVTIEQCEQTRNAADEARREVEQSRRARPVVEARAALDAAQSSLAEARGTLAALNTSVEEFFAGLGMPCPEFTAASVAAEVRSIQGGIDNDEQMLKAAASTDRAALEAEAKAEGKSGELAAQKSVVTVAASRRQAVQQRLDECSPVAAGVEQHQRVHDEAKARCLQRAQLESCVAALNAALAVARGAQEADEATWKAFVATQAPRLAAELQPGGPCPVCGSTEHPSPAVLGDDDSVDHAAVERARAARLTAEAKATELAGQEGALRLGLGAAADHSVEALQAEVDAADAALSGALAARHEAAGLEAELVRASEVLSAAEERERELELEVVAATADAQVKRQEADRLQAEVQHLDPTELDHRRSTVDAMKPVVDHLGDAFAGQVRAEQSHRSAEDAFDIAVSASGFESEAAATCAVLDVATEAARASEYEDWDQRFTTATTKLAAVEALGVPEVRPDVEALERLAADASEALASISARHTTAANALDAARRSLATSQQLAHDSADVRAQRDTATIVFKTCNGEAGIRVKLESWVLAAELDRVTAAANVHLGRMSKGRYRLSREGGRSALGLEVFDAHTGRARATASLSGGEQFQASLSLALGLADVVSHGGTASGKQFEALFVDEGFGSLDPQALDDAIEALSQIQAGGRIVGAITHVEGMKERLHTGIEVKALPDGKGSTLTVIP